MLSTNARLALRTLGRHRGFTVVAVLALAIAIALNTTMYSVLDAMLRPRISARTPENIYWIRYYSDDHRRHDYTAIERTLQAGMPGYEAVTGQSYWGFALRQPLVENGARYKRAIPVIVRPNYFQFLGTVPLEGRVFAPNDENGGTPVTVISDRLASSLFPDESPVGRAITIDGNGFTVIGVVPQTAAFLPLDHDVWILRPATVAQPPLTMIRLREGVDRNAVNSQLATIAAQIALATGEPVGRTGFLLRQFQIRHFRVGEFHFALFGAVGAVLLVACANLANLQLARGLARTRELALRSAVGASRRQLVGLLLTESAILAGAGLAFGLVLTLWAIRIVKAAIPPYINEYMIAPQTSWRMLVFAAGAAVLCLFLVGLLPALRVSRVDPDTLLKSTSGTGANRAHRRRYGMMVIAQIGFALPVLIGAFVLFKEGLRLRSRDFVVGQRYGYDPAPLISANLHFMPGTGSGVRAAALIAEIESRTKASPGVLEAAGSFSRTPIGPALSLDDENGIVREEFAPRWAYHVVSPSYFRTFGLPIERGRDFSDGEFGRSVIMDAPSARLLWSGRDPIGRAIKFGNARSGEPWYRVVGIVGDLRKSTTARHVNPTPPSLNNVYAVVAPDDTMPLKALGFTHLTVYARVKGNTELAAVRLQRLLRATPSGQNAEVAPLESRYMTYVRTRQDFVASLFVTFAVLGLGLVAIGVYGIVAHSIAERRRELAVRISLGATPRNILHSVLREGNALILAGIAIGLLFTKYTVWWLGAFMDDAAGYDAPMFALIAGGLFALAVAAALVPAWRATRIDPVEALRHE